MLKRSIETVERHNLMNAKQRLNTVKGLEDDVHKIQVNYI